MARNGKENKEGVEESKRERRVRGRMRKRSHGKHNEKGGRGEEDSHKKRRVKEDEEKLEGSVRKS